VASTAEDLIRLANSPQQAALLDAFVLELQRRSQGHAHSPAGDEVNRDGVPSG
jgi:hypothetical protein